MGRDKNDPSTQDRPMELSSTLSWLVDTAADSAGADRLELGAHLFADGLPLAGGSLTLEIPHPLIARRTWLWRAESGEVIEALGFAPGGPAATPAANTLNDALAQRNCGGPCARGHDRLKARRAFAQLDRPASIRNERD
jgi:hypothetical protein